jgi:hypothetical protein
MLWETVASELSTHKMLSQPTLLSNAKSYRPTPPPAQSRTKRRSASLTAVMPPRRSAAAAHRGGAGTSNPAGAGPFRPPPSWWPAARALFYVRPTGAGVGLQGRAKDTSPRTVTPPTRHDTRRRHASPARGERRTMDGLGHSGLSARVIGARYAHAPNQGDPLKLAAGPREGGCQRTGSARLSMAATLTIRQHVHGFAARTYRA